MFPNQDRECTMHVPWNLWKPMIQLFHIYWTTTNHYCIFLYMHITSETHLPLKTYTFNQYVLVSIFANWEDRLSQMQWCILFRAGWNTPAFFVLLLYLLSSEHVMIQRALSHPLPFWFYVWCVMIYFIILQVICKFYTGFFFWAHSLQRDICSNLCTTFFEELLQSNRFCVSVSYFLLKSQRLGTVWCRGSSLAGIVAAVSRLQTRACSERGVGHGFLSKKRLG